MKAVFEMAHFDENLTTGMMYMYLRMHTAINDLDDPYFPDG